MEDDDDAMDLDFDIDAAINPLSQMQQSAEVSIAALVRSTELSMVGTKPCYLTPRPSGAEACRNGHSAVSALVDKVRGWLKAGKVAAVPERIRHAFLQVRHYAKQHGGSLQIDFIQTTKPMSVPPYCIASTLLHRFHPTASL